MLTVWVSFVSDIHPIFIQVNGLLLCVLISCVLISSVGQLKLQNNVDLRFVGIVKPCVRTGNYLEGGLWLRSASVVSKCFYVFVTIEQQQINAECKLCCQRIYLVYMLNYF